MANFFFWRPRKSKKTYLFFVYHLLLLTSLKHQGRKRNVAVYEPALQNNPYMLQTKSELLEPPTERDNVLQTRHDCNGTWRTLGTGALANLRPSAHSRRAPLPLTTCRALGRATVNSHCRFYLPNSSAHAPTAPLFICNSCNSCCAVRV